jgi:serine/threonine protein kinase
MKDEGLMPFILYRGKKYEGTERKLGEGGFGSVKLAQDYNTNELVAVKIQNVTMLPEEVYATERDMLKTIGMFRGTVKRDEKDKDYLIQALLYGSNLEEHLESSKDSTEVLDIIVKASEQISKLHEINLIHRDIKLENFMWDPETKKMELIDFAFVQEVEGNHIRIMRDDAGSDTYKSPEVVDFGEYSKRSDLFALGVMIEEIVKDNHPKIYQEMKDDIELLKSPNVNDRPLNLKDTIAHLVKLQKSQLDPATARKLT